MRYLYCFFALLLISIHPSCKQKKEIQTWGTAYTNGQWYNGKDFISKVFYEVDGIFSDESPDSIVKTTDLKGGYVIPPFASAHNHNLDREWQLGFLPKAYLDEGTFYYQALTSMQKQANALRSFFENDSTIDVKFAQQGLTSTLGHPFMAYEPFSMGLTFDNWESNMDKILQSRIEENNSYIFIDSISQIDEKLNIFYNSNPDVAKIYLLDVENYKVNSNTGTAGLHGLSKPVARLVAEKLKKKGFTVYAHIETASDFEFAAEIGVDCVAHMPGYGFEGLPENELKYYVDDQSMQKAASKGMRVIPTTAISISRRTIKDSLAKTAFTKSFLTRFKNAGGNIIVGSDMFNMTLTPEIDALHALDIFSNEELLKILTMDTPQYVFPERKIGKLEAGYEASFLVLENNPLRDFSAIKDIVFAAKQGIVLPN
ncbi:hypothetical protein GTQ34_01225 [Muricauda sp. JGD-17]|uniref:Amidohydrolase family protein n=1 Tax=Flagellimonas ochracea TaxID=2696472 RepID=A0A964T947_9FLAO|nr:hypothetical protein [Allomuricauda ochracea]NAY90525.1 hypothetical protein [Allomuricauda ochracea]